MGLPRRAGDAAELRKSWKPLLEKRRRARINESLRQLKGLVLPLLGRESSRCSKLEKADILEMTVRFLQDQPASSCPGAAPTPPDSYREGYRACVERLARVLPACRALEPAVGARLLEHLRRRAAGAPPRRRERWGLLRPSLALPAARPHALAACAPLSPGPLAALVAPRAGPPTLLTERHPETGRTEAALGGDRHRHHEGSARRPPHSQSQSQMLGIWTEGPGDSVPGRKGRGPASLPTWGAWGRWLQQRMKPLPLPVAGGSRAGLATAAGTVSTPAPALAPARGLG